MRSYYISTEKQGYIHKHLSFVAEHNGVIVKVKHCSRVAAADMWKDAGNRSRCLELGNQLLHSVFPSSCRLTPPNATTERIGSLPLPSPVSRTLRRTRDKCHRAKSETKRIWNFKMKRRNKCTGGQREGDNNKKGGGVKSYRCSPHPDTAGLRPWDTLIHHYRFTISLSWPPPPTQEQLRGCIPGSRRQHKTNKPNNMHTRIDLVPGDQMNLPIVR